MSSRPHDDMSQGFIPNSISSSNVPPEPRLACPVSSCNFVHEGKRAKRNLMSHLNRPKISRRTGQEKAAWLNLHRIALNRILAATEKDKAYAERGRAAEFESRARRMGITEKRLVAQKVAIWDGMLVAKMQGNDIDYDAWVLLDAATSAHQ